MKGFFTVFLLLTCCVVGVAQNAVRYDVEPTLEAIQSDYVKVWGELKEISGYRIQLGAFTGSNSKTAAEGERHTFLNHFPDIPAYISYAEPYFRLRVGDFYSRLEAYKRLLEIQTMYPNAYIVIEKVIYSE